MTLRDILDKVYASECPSDTLSVLVTSFSDTAAEHLYNMATFAVGDYSICYPLPYEQCEPADGAHLHVHDNRFNELLAILEACA